VHRPTVVARGFSRAITAVAARGFSRAITAVRRTNSIDVDQDSIRGDQTAVGGGR